MNKKGLPAAALLVLAALLILSTVASAQQNAPKFFVREKEVDLGNFFEGVDIDYSFTVRNNGVGELHVLSVRPG